MQGANTCRCSTAPFAVATAAWALAGIVAHELAHYVAEIYRGESTMPFTLSLWWKLIPWLAIGFLVVDFATARAVTLPTICSGCRRWKYRIFVGAAIAFAILSFLPLDVLMGKQ